MLRHLERNGKGKLRWFINEANALKRAYRKTYQYGVVQLWLTEQKAGASSKHK
jgi:hypothetical protein